MNWRRPLSFTPVAWGLLIPVLFLSVVGLLTVHATDRSTPPGEVSIVDDEREGGASLWLPGFFDALGPRTARQAVFLVTGLVLMALTVRPSYAVISDYAYVLYGLLTVLLVLLLVDRYVDLPLIPNRNHVRRWISLGFIDIQPSEFMKAALVLTLARYLRFRDSYRRWSGLAAPFLLTLAPMVLILRQPNLGTTLMLLPVLFAMLFVAGARRRHLAAVVLAGAATLPIFYFYGMHDYQRQRVQVLLRQGSQDEAWHMAEGFQLRQAKVAIGTGGLLGTGYDKGVFIRHDLLPEEHNDVIFAIIGHQWGFVGSIVIILAYVLIAAFGVEAAAASQDPVARLIAIGASTMITVQALLNISMTIGLAPITGMNLPFVSAGGSSLWANFLAAGLLLNVSQRRPLVIARPAFEFADGR